MVPIRVLHITGVAHGGVATVVDQLARGLDRNRYEPQVLFGTPLESDIRNKLSNTDIKTINMMECGDRIIFGSHSFRKRKNLAYSIETYLGKNICQGYLSLKSFCTLLLWQLPKIRLLIRTYRENNIRLVHTHNELVYAGPEIIAAWATRIPCICHSHSYSKLNYWDKLLVKLVNYFIYISKHQADHFCRQGIPAVKGRVIHNGIDTSKFAKRYDAGSVRREFGVKNSEPLIGLIGRIDWWKGHEYFIEAMASVIREVPGTKALIVGELAWKNIYLNRYYLEKLHSLVQLFDLEDNIIFTGFRSDIPRLLSGMDVVVHASSEPEPFGLVIIEGMAAGKPVVGTAAGGVLDIIEDGVNGLLVPCKDSKAMARAVIQLLSNRTCAEKIAQLGRSSVVEKFTLKKQLSAVQYLYDSLLKAF